MLEAVRIANQILDSPSEQAVMPLFQARLLKQARLKYPQAAIEDIDTRPARGVDRRTVMSLALGDWVSTGQSVLISEQRPFQMHNNGLK
jgi:hypothetical protein